MSGEIILFEKHNGAWLPRNYLPALDKGVIGGIIGGDLSLTATALIFESKGGSDNITISLKTISSFQEAELGFGRDGGGDGVGSICIKTHDDYSKEIMQLLGDAATGILFKVSDPKKWLMELERCIGKGTSVDMNMMETDSSNSELKNTCKRCGKIWYLDADELQDLEKSSILIGEDLLYNLPEIEDEDETDEFSLAISSDSGVDLKAFIEVKLLSSRNFQLKI